MYPNPIWNSTCNPFQTMMPTALPVGYGPVNQIPVSAYGCSIPQVGFSQFSPVAGCPTPMNVSSPWTTGQLPLTAGIPCQPGLNTMPINNVYAAQCALPYNAVNCIPGYNQISCPPVNAFSQIGCPPVNTFSQIGCPPVNTFSQIGCPPVNTFSQIGCPPVNTMSPIACSPLNTFNQVGYSPVSALGCSPVDMFSQVGYSPVSTLGCSPFNSLNPVACSPLTGLNRLPAACLQPDRLRPELRHAVRHQPGHDQPARLHDGRPHQRLPDRNDRSDPGLLRWLRLQHPGRAHRLRWHELQRARGRSAPAVRSPTGTPVSRTARPSVGRPRSVRRCRSSIRAASVVSAPCPTRASPTVSVTSPGTAFPCTTPMNVNQQLCNPMTGLWNQTSFSPMTGNYGYNPSVTSTLRPTVRTAANCTTI